MKITAKLAKILNYRFFLILFFVFLFLVPFVFSFSLMNGLVTAKQWMLAGVAMVGIFGYSIEQLFTKKNSAIKITTIDFLVIIYFVYVIINYIGQSPPDSCNFIDSAGNNDTSSVAVCYNG
jgi:hypothetical protein